jgi:hypothetical protein
LQRAEAAISDRNLGKEKEKADLQQLPPSLIIPTYARYFASFSGVRLINHHAGNVDKCALQCLREPDSLHTDLQ